MNKKLKVLIVQEVILDYRVPIFNKLAEKYDLSIAAANHSKTSFDYKFYKINFVKVGQLALLYGLNRILNTRFDCIILLFNIRIVNIYRLIFGKNRDRIILWGIGVTSERGYDSNSKFDWIRYFLANRVGALLFYCAYPKNKYSRI